jgi:hypothetical protein
LLGSSAEADPLLLAPPHPATTALRSDARIHIDGLNIFSTLSIPLLLIAESMRRIGVQSAHLQVLDPAFATIHPGSGKVGTLANILRIDGRLTAAVSTQITALDVQGESPTQKNIIVFD